MKNAILGIIGIILFLGGMTSGYIFFKKSNNKTQVNSEVILTMLKSEGFLVSQTYIFNQVVTIDKNTGSAWKDIFWGQTITASANIKVNSGVDLAKLQQDDVKITSQEIIINIPPVEQKSIELLGNIILQNKQGILKKIFDNDPGYNIAYTKLKEEALNAIVKDELQQEARNNTEKQLIRLLQFVQPDRKIRIEFKA